MTALPDDWTPPPRSERWATDPEYRKRKNARERERRARRKAEREAATMES